MFWSFLAILLFSAVAFIVAFWLVCLVAALPTQVFGRTKSAPFFYLLSNLIAGYTLCLWPAFCAVLLRSKIQQPAVHHRWIYYVSAILLGLAGTLFAVRAVFKDPLLYEADTDEEPSELTDRVVGTVKLRGYLLMLATLALIAFLIWPSIAQAVYGWVLNRLI